jgi:hypothetical protein
VAERGLSRARWYALVAVLVTMLLIGAANVVYTNAAVARQEQQRRDNDRRWCALLLPLDEAYRATPPTTQTGRDVAAAIHTQRVSFHC